MRPRRRAAMAATGLLALLGASSCGGKVPAARYYVLEAPLQADRPGGEVPDRGAPVVAVPPVQVAPPYDQDRVVYRIGDDDPRARFYPYDRWAVPLDRMLADLVATVLDGAGGRRFVSGAAAAGGEALIGRLDRIEEVDRDGVPHVRFGLALELVVGSGPRRGVWRLESDVPAQPGARMEDLIRLLRDELVAALQALRPLVGAGLEGSGTAR